MTERDALSYLDEIPDEIRQAVLRLVYRPINRGVYEAQRLLAYYLGNDVADRVVSALVRKELRRIERLN